MTKHKDLADKIEALEGPNRELDCLIGEASGRFRKEQCKRKGLCWVRLDEDGGEVWPGYGGAQLVPSFTSSLDAAMTLVPEGMRLQLFNWDHEALREKGPWQAILVEQGCRDTLNMGFRCDHAATPALALCAAALRASQ